MIEARNLSFSYGNTQVLHQINFTAHPGEITAVIGANGVGKSTLLRCAAGMEHFTGELLIDGKDASRFTQREHSSKIGYLCQNTGCRAELNVFEVILTGLVNELSFRVSQEDIDRVESILDLMDIRSFAHRKITQLSGGQQQLVLIAQTLVKKPDILIMDEPTSALDLNRQFRLMELIKQITKENNFTTIVCHHHLDLVSKYADQVLVLQNGRVFCQDTPVNAFTREMFQQVYKMDVEFYTDSQQIRHMVPVNRMIV